MQNAYASILTSFSGVVRHAQERTLTLDWDPDPLTLAPHAVTVPLSSNGAFHVTLPGSLRLPAEVRLSHGDNELLLYISPGDGLEISVDADRFITSARFSGAGAMASRFLVLYAQKFPEAMGELPDTELAECSPQQYRQLVDAERAQRLAYWNNYVALHPTLLPDFRAYVGRTIAYAWAATLLSFTVPANGSPRRIVPLTSDTTFHFLQLLPRPIPMAALRERTYLSFLASFAVARLRPLEDTTTWSPPLTALQVQELYTTAEHYLGRDRSRDVAMGLALYRQLLTIDAGDFAPQLAVFNRFNRDSAVARTLRRNYRLRLPLAAGRPAPAFALCDSTGKRISLDDLRGKVIYLDFWASWCAPCLAELPALRPLKQQFAGKPVVFAYISIDEDPRAWRAALRRFPMLGGSESIHLRDGGFSTATVRAYQLTGVPSYWVIGRDGRIISGNAPRPSSGKPAINLIMEALGK